jgi:hypothetical protein
MFGIVSQLALDVAVWLFGFEQNARKKEKFKQYSTIFVIFIAFG